MRSGLYSTYKCNICQILERLWILHTSCHSCNDSLHGFTIVPCMPNRCFLLMLACAAPPLGSPRHPEDARQPIQPQVIYVSRKLDLQPSTQHSRFMNTPTDAMQMSWVPHLSLMCGLMHAACMWCRDDNIRWTAPTLLARATNRRQRYFKSREEIRQKYAGKPPWNRFTKGSLNAYIEHAFKRHSR